jgi:RHS repeat-associated protein
VQALDYHFDALGNLEYRQDTIADLFESFTYDNLNRLDTTSLTVGTTSASFNVDYDHLGNVSFKTGVGSYQYGNGRPHAVSAITGGALAGSYNYDANGNMTSGGGRSQVNYNTMDKPTLIVTADKTIGYQYGMGGSRFKRTDTDGGTTQTTLYVGNVEFISTGGVSSEIQRQIEGVALETYYPATNVRKLQYLHYDHLGSIDVITDDSGTVVQKFSYDAWGQRRDAGTFMTGSFSTVDRAISFQMGNFKRGFTGHEHIDDAGLIHMNGRVYDARLARFMSADPLVTAGDNLQAYNRYSYVWNNPLNATDPSGYEPVSGIIIAMAAVIGAEASYAIYIASQIYSVYSIVQGVYGAIQAFKYDQGLGGVLALAQAAYSGYNLYNAGGWGKSSWEARTGNSGVVESGKNGIRTQPNQGSGRTINKAEYDAAVKNGSGKFDTTQTKEIDDAVKAVRSKTKAAVRGLEKNKNLKRVVDKFGGLKEKNVILTKSKSILDLANNSTIDTFVNVADGFCGASAIACVVSNEFGVTSLGSNIFLEPSFFDPRTLAASYTTQAGVLVHEYAHLAGASHTLSDVLIRTSTKLGPHGHAKAVYNAESYANFLVFK